MASSNSGIKERLESFHLEMTESLRVNLRNHSQCQLVIVTKRHPVSVVMEAYQCGERHFGESQIQEGIPKVKAMPEDVIWHFIGHVQKNKVRKVMQHFKYIHSVDNLDLLERMSRIAEEERVRPKVFLQVNLLGQSSRFGFSPEDLPLVLERQSEFPRIECIGLMGLPPVDSELSDLAYFELLKKQKDHLAASFPEWPGLLSMGMSHDFQDAIAMGSNFLRIGTRIVGERI